MDQPNQINNLETPGLEVNTLNLGEVPNLVRNPESIKQLGDTNQLNIANNAVVQATSGIATQLPLSLVANQQQTGVQLAAATPVIADDTDVIEKEWVQKAKKIVADTQNDPHSRNNEFTYFKHDYVKSRFGKENKLPDKQAA